MQANRSTPDETCRQNLRNSVGQIESALMNAQTDLRELVTEFDFMAEHGAPEQTVAARVDVARRAVKLQELLPRLQELVDKIKKLAGEKAVRVAESPDRVSAVRTCRVLPKVRLPVLGIWPTGNGRTQSPLLGRR